MTNVWYVGRYGKRQLSVKDWAQLGVVTTTPNEWSLDNGWSLPESDFTPTQLSILAGIDEFQTGQDGPRIKTPSPAITGGSSPFSIYFEKMKFLFDNFFTLKSAFDSQYFSLITSLKHEVWHDFTNDPNGIPVNVDSGGSWTVHVGQSKNDLVVQSGLYSRVGVARFASDSNPLATQAKSPTKAQLLRAQGLLQNAFVTLAGIQTLVNKTINAPKINYILDANGKAMFNMLPTVNAVNYLQLQNNVTTGPPVITAVGSDANIDIVMAGKGIGQVKAYNGTQYSRVLTAQPRLQAISTGATHTINVDTADFFGVTAQNVAATIAAPTGTPTTGQVLRIRLQDNGTSQSLTWDAIWRAVGITLPTATIAGKVMYLIAVWNAGAVKWDVIDLKVQA